MNDPVGAVLAGIATGVAVLLVIAAVTNPTCEDRGGELKANGVIPIWNGSSMTYVPSYECVIDEQKTPEVSEAWK